MERQKYRNFELPRTILDRMGRESLGWFSRPAAATILARLGLTSAIIAFGMVPVALAQANSNPLRIDPSGPEAVYPAPGPDPSPSEVGTYTAETAGVQELPAVDVNTRPGNRNFEQSGPRSPITDSNLVRAGFHASPDAGRTLEPGNEIRKEIANRNENRIAGLPMDETVRKIALNTILVMAIAVTFIFVARKSRTGVVSPSKLNVPLQVEQSLSIGNKATLKLVRIGEQRVLVAVDASGVKSVVSLHEEFPANFADNAESMDVPAHDSHERSNETAAGAQVDALLLQNPEFQKWLFNQTAHRNPSSSALPRRRA